MQSLRFQAPDISSNEMKVRAFGRGFINQIERFQKLQIEDIPIMITNDNEILCIPKTNETKHIGISGMTGTLKSLTLNAILGWDYWMIKNLCINLNDFQKETFEWSQPSHSFQYILDKYHIEPRPTPLVYVFPSTKTLKIEEKDKRFPLIKMSLPFREAIENVRNYWSLDKSDKYFVNVKQDLLECSSPMEIKDFIEENFPNRKGEGMSDMGFKLWNVFQTFFTEEMINVATPEAPAYLEYQDKYGNSFNDLTIQTLARAGFVPSIQTTDLRNKEYFSAYMSFIVESIYNSKYDNPFFKSRNLSLFVDEIDKLWQGHNRQLIKSKLCLIGTNGRAARIGLRWSTQHYEKVPDQIRGNTKYLFVSRKSDAKEVREIKKDFDIPKDMEKQILNLVTDANRGIFQMVALSTERFICYDLVKGTKKYTSTNEAKFGTLIPPQANHRVPGVNI